MSDRCEMAPSDRRLEPKRSGASRVVRLFTHLGWDVLRGDRVGCRRPARARRPDHLRAQPACRMPTAAFSIVGAASSTAFAAGPSGTKLSSLVTRVTRPA